MQNQPPLTAGNYTHNNYCQIGFDKNVLETLPIAMYTCAVDGTITFYNHAAAELWGRKPEIGIEKWTGAYKFYSAKGKLLPKDYHPIATLIAEGKAIPVEEL
ncbi:MAG: hypothetical protein DI539_00005, partial [Flavobacterium psychrophilum]